MNMFVKNTNNSIKCIQRQKRLIRNKRDYIYEHTHSKRDLTLKTFNDPLWSNTWYLSI